MSDVLTLPRLGETMESGRIVAWQKKAGEAFRRGETIVEVESDKTTVELPALVNGTLLEIIAAEGEDVTVGAPLCRYDRADAPAAAPATAAAKAPVIAKPIAEPKQIAAIAVPAAGRAADRPRATPAARHLARKHAIDLDAVRGTGRRARIGKADVLALVASPGAGTAIAPDGAITMRSIDLPQGRLAYRQWRATGAAHRTTAVLLHGFAGDSLGWSTLATHVTRLGRDVIAPDLPAHGATAIAATSFAQLVEPLIAFINGRNERIELVGHSLGGAVAVAVALAAPDCVERLTLIAPAGLGSEIDADFVAGMASVRSVGAAVHLLRRIVVRPAPLSQAQLEQFVAAIGGGTRLGALAGALAADGRQQIDIVADLERLGMPVRVVWGLDDRIIPWTHVAHLPAHVPAHLIADAGHLPQWDQPAKTASLFA